MIKREWNLILDFNGKNSIVPSISMIQGDTDAYKLTATLIMDKNAINLADYTVRFLFSKPDHTTVYKDANIVDANSGKISLDIDSNITAATGKGSIQLQLKDNDTGQLSSGAFNFVVTSTMLNEDIIISTNDFTVLQNALNSLAAYDGYKNDVVGLKTDMGTAALTTTAQNVKGAINELDSSLAEKANNDYINTLMSTSTQYRRNIAVSTAEFDDGTKTDLEVLQAAHDYVENTSFGELVLHRDFTIIDTFNWNISRVKIDGKGRTIYANINDLNKYAINLYSEPLFGYVSPQNNKVISGGHFNLNGQIKDNEGNIITIRTCMGIRCAGTAENNLSNFIIEKVTVRHFDKGVVYGSHAYMISFFASTISFNRYNLYTNGTLENMGERLDFICCDLTGTQGIADSYCIYNASSTNAGFFFTNCSFDWNRRLYYNIGHLIFNNCWTESPQYALDDNNQFGECSYQGYVSFTGGKFLLNHIQDSTTPRTIKSIFKLNHNTSRIDIKGVLWLTDWYDFIAIGDGKINFQIKSPMDNMPGMHYFISNSVRSNYIIDPKFSFSLSSVLDKWAISNGSNPQVIAELGGFKCIKIRNTGNTDSYYTTLTLAIDKIETYFKFGIDYYFSNNSTFSSIEVRFYTTNGVYISLPLTVTDFTNSNNEWKNLNITKQLTQHVVNLDAVKSIEIRFNVSSMTGVDGFYLKEGNFQCF